MLSVHFSHTCHLVTEMQHEYVCDICNKPASCRGCRNCDWDICQGCLKKLYHAAVKPEHHGHSVKDIALDVGIHVIAEALFHSIGSFFATVLSVGTLNPVDDHVMIEKWNKVSKCGKCGGSLGGWK